MTTEPCGVCGVPRGVGGCTGKDCRPLHVRPYVPEPSEEPLPAETVPTDLGIFDFEPQVFPEHETEEKRRGRGGRRLAVSLAAVGAAALAVVGASAVTMSVLESPDRGERVGADDAPMVTPPKPTTALPVLPDQPLSRSATPTHTPTRSATPTPPASAPTAASSSPAAPASPVIPMSPVSPSPAAPTAPTSPSAGTTSQAPQVLREGDSGPAVTDMQERLRTLWVHRGDADGEFDTEWREAVTHFQNWYNVEGDPKGVYGVHTRAALEEKTS